MEPSLSLIADTLLILGTLTAAFYCHVLARRVRALRRMDTGLGSAIAAFSKQVEDMQAALQSAREISGDGQTRLLELTARAEMAAGRLELLLAALHEQDGATPIRGRAASRPQDDPSRRATDQKALAPALDELTALARRLDRSDAFG